MTMIVGIENIIMLIFSTKYLHFLHIAFFCHSSQVKVTAGAYVIAKDSDICQQENVITHVLA